MSIGMELTPLERNGRRGLGIAATVASSGEPDLESQYDAIDAALAAHGMRLADIVRTRILAASREARDRASLVRFRRCSGPARCATSSYIDAALFPVGDGVRIEGIALAGAGANKIAVEYDPVQPPCRYVATGDLVFCSGVTSTLPTFEEQLANLRPRIAETLRLAGERLGRVVQPESVTAYVHRAIDPGGSESLARRLGLPGGPLVIGWCDGYSAPGKLIEVEVDALASTRG